ncbi:DUF4381 domain-containing protein [Paracoccus sp. KR1-242]|uniref:DUF4381 domain-containing protein n=1 Tax=Paracoccus sp. KR1-242 TaxID=3410028 RepID=UPI003C043EEF
MNPDDAAAPAAKADDLVSLISQLHELREPAAVSMWPATPIWWVLAAAVTLLLLFVAWRWRQRRRANAYRRAALAALRAIEPALARGDVPALAQLDLLLRRTALAAFPRKDVAALTGPAWADYLDHTDPELPHGGFRELSPSLADTPYMRQPGDVQGARLAELARHWIRHHHA